ncbi:hypothetical protein FOZ62_001536 [Perkinsus olseni]|uniref:Uncharacterized protein n=1 Tax=Perkinsus olseni TaxID=32597 RepID=A0A7J6U0X3_PEROL|nr:hypothetical protein FOZ62_001536 [Perkinsus olseni]
MRPRHASGCYQKTRPGHAAACLHRRGKSHAAVCNHKGWDKQAAACNHKVWAKQAAVCNHKGWAKQAAACNHKGWAKQAAISVGAGQLGCNIFTGAPLEPMDFYFKFSDKEGITSTHLIDRNRNDTYIFQKNENGFNAAVGDVNLWWAPREYWEEVKNAGVLPLGRLSEQTDKILKAVASGPSHYQFKQCLHVVDVILKDPPVGYETVAEDWILQVHRNTKGKSHRR